MGNKSFKGSLLVIRLTPVLRSTRTQSQVCKLTSAPDLVLGSRSQAKRARWDQRSARRHIAEGNAFPLLERSLVVDSTGYINDDQTILEARHLSDTIAAHLRLAEMSRFAPPEYRPLVSGHPIKPRSDPLIAKKKCLRAWKAAAPQGPSGHLRAAPPCSYRLDESGMSRRDRVQIFGAFRSDGGWSMLGDAGSADRCRLTWRRAINRARSSISSASGRP